MTFTTPLAGDPVPGVRHGSDADNSRPGPRRPPFPQVPGVTHRFVNIRGVRLHVAEAGSGDPVVPLHSFPPHCSACGTSSRCWPGSTG